MLRALFEAAEVVELFRVFQILHTVKRFSLLIQVFTYRTKI